VYLSSEKETPTSTRPRSGRFNVRPRLSAALLSRLISSVLARLLSALDDGELEDCDLVALALAVDQPAFTSEVTGGRRKSRSSDHTTRRRSTSSTDTPQRQSVDGSQRTREIIFNQVIGITQAYWSRYDKPLPAARCCHVANDFTYFTGDRRTNKQTDRGTSPSLKFLLV